MFFIFDGVTFGIVVLVAIIAICGGATAIANFIISHMTAILIVFSIVFLISLALYWITINETLKNKVYKIIIMIISFAESVLSVFALRELMLHFVECQRTMGFFKFALEVILSSIFGLIPIFVSKLFSMTIAIGAEEEIEKEGSKFALIAVMQIGFTALIVTIINYF